MRGCYCQSCGMPMRAEGEHGTEAGGALSTEYCTYCYQGGAFTQPYTMDEMIELCLKFEQERDPGLDVATARAAMGAWFPTLKRWQR